MGVPNKIFVIAVLMVLSTTSAHALASYQQPSDLNKVTKFLFSSECPGWICYAEKKGGEGKEDWKSPKSGKGGEERN